MDNFLPREKRAIMIIQYYQLNADRFLFFYSACCVQNSLCSKILEGFLREYYNVKVKNSSLLTLQPVLLLNCCHEQKFFLSLGAILFSSLRLVFFMKILQSDSVDNPCQMRIVWKQQMIEANTQKW